VNPALSSLVVGDRVVSRCEDGLLGAEYALFDRSDVILSAASGQGVREHGYMTTAGSARAQLREARITTDLARDAFAALRTGHLRVLATTPAVLRVVEQLGPYEAFEGGTYSAATGRYAGTWLDLDALAQACPLRAAPLLFQALHLLLVVEEVRDDVPVRLLTAPVADNGRPGERTWHHVPLDGAKRLPAVLRAMRVPTRPPAPARDETEVDEELLRNLRSRATVSVKSPSRVRGLAALLVQPAAAPAADVSAAQELAHQLTRVGRPPSSQSRLPLQPLNPLPLFEELRRHTDLLRGEEHLRAVAQFLSAMAERRASLPELAVLAARAWLAAGEHRYARHFAKYADNPAAPESARIMALEILESSPATNESMLPPPVMQILPAPVIMISAKHESGELEWEVSNPEAVEWQEPSSEELFWDGSDRAAPPGASMPPYSREPETEAEPEPPTQPEPEPPPATVRIPARATVEQIPGRATVEPIPTRPKVEPTSTPAGVPAPMGPLRSEIVETLPLPDGAREDMLEVGAFPRNALEMRIAMTRFSREVGRDYRLFYGTTLKADLLAIDAMQRHLRRRFADGAIDDKHARLLEAELTRHGALVSEILARSLGAEWVDFSSEQPGHWAMMLGSDLRVWPIGRVYRFFRQGHRESDLVAFYIDLEARARRG
jgi:hypothetical protein